MSMKDKKAFRRIIKQNASQSQEDSKKNKPEIAVGVNCLIGVSHTIDSPDTNQSFFLNTKADNRAKIMLTDLKGHVTERIYLDERIDDSYEL